MLAIIDFILNRLVPLLKKHKVEQLHLTLFLIYVVLMTFQLHKVIQINEHLMTILKFQLCMPLLLLSISCFLFLWLRDRPKYDKFLNVYWDKNNELHCPSCKRLLAPSFFGDSVNEEKDKSLFQCNFCTKKVILKDNNGKPISKAEAIKLRNNPNQTLL